MAKHSHDFVETYVDLVGFGMDREIDEATVIVMLQKLSDDALMDLLRHRLSDEELKDLFEMVSNLLKEHLSEEEYHTFFLKDREEESL
ncbi:MAG: cytoplasmic protein [Deltaproteobacteria bacterium]|nr:cytoplasmic protein [Deltaproteobacteria bacterium]